MLKRNIDRHHFGVRERDLISHHKFRKAIALHWINPEKYLVRINNDTTISERVPMSNLCFVIASRSRRSKRGKILPHLTVLMATTLSRDSTKRSESMNNETLLVTNLLLNIRINRTLNHLPENPKSKKCRCGLCMWFRIETQKDILFYPTYNVNLCIKCYKIFHNSQNIVAMKMALYSKNCK